MQVSIGRTAYVSNTPDGILDTLQCSPIQVSIIGDGTVVTKESVEDFLNNYKENMEEHERTRYLTLKNFLVEALEAIKVAACDGTDSHIGDIFFTI